MKRQQLIIMVLTMALMGSQFFSPATANLKSTTLTGSIRGKVTDEKGEEVGGAMVSAFQKGVLIKRTETDLINGTFRMDTLPEGMYELKVEAIGYATKLVKDVQLKSEKTITVNIQLTGSTLELKEVEVISFRKPLFEKDQNTTGGAISREEIRRAPANTGAYSKTGSAPNIRGQRSNGTIYHVDGVRVPNESKNKKYAPPANQEFNTEEYGHLAENDWKKSKEDPLSTFSIDVDAASYSNIRRFLSNGQMPPKDAVRIEEMINYFKYDYPQPKGNDPFSVTTEMAVCPWNKNHKLIQIGLQGKNIAVDNLPASNLVFLVDVSGSMNGPNRLPLVKSSLRLLVAQLRPQDKVAMVVYAGAAGLVLPSTSGKEKDKILEAIESLEAGGSTAGGAGIALAYKVAKDNFRKDGNNRVILATDGDFNVGASSDGELIRMIEEKRESGIFLTVLGYGMGNYKDRKMEQLANKGNGNYAYIDNLMEAKKVLVNEFGGTLFTIAKDVKLQVEWNPAQVKGYRLIGYENRMLNKEDFNDDKKDAGEMGAGHTVTALYEIIPASSKEEVKGSVDELKYQDNKKAGNSDNKNDAAIDEVLTVKLRYKKPDGDKSILLSQVLKHKEIDFEEAPENLRWAATVASFGMLLRGSAYKGDTSYEKVISWAKSAKGKDDEGYRAEFIRLVEMAAIHEKGQGRK